MYESSSLSPTTLLKTGGMLANNYEWLILLPTIARTPDGSLDWIDNPYPNDVADLYGENDCPQDNSCDDWEDDEC